MLCFLLSISRQPFAASIFFASHTRFHFFFKSYRSRLTTLIYYFSIFDCILFNYYLVQFILFFLHLFRIFFAALKNFVGLISNSEVTAIIFNVEQIYLAKLISFNNVYKWHFILGSRPS